MLIRIRTNVGLWRIDNLNEMTAKVSDILSGISQTRPNVVYESPLSLDPACKTPVNPETTLKSQNLTHGSMIYCRVDASTCVESKPETIDNADASQTSMTRKVIAKDGTIQLQPTDPTVTTTGQDRGFRPGMLALRDMKMQWTLHDFMAMDDRYIFRVKRQDASWTSVSLDSDSCQDFSRYLSMFTFQRHRFGYLYGTAEKEEGEEEAEQDVEPKWKVKVECIYEPPQEPDPDSPEGFQLLEDEREERVDKLASMLGLQKVGWIFGHAPREDNIDMTSAEIIMAAELQLEAASGVKPTPFVTVKVSKGSSGNISFEAFQVSLQCMEMVAEQALEVDPNELTVCSINDTFTAIQEGKESKTIENSFFLTVVPIHRHTSETFVSQFPKCNREHEEKVQSESEMKKQLSKSGSQGWTFIDLLSDFHLLLYLCQFLDLDTDMVKICQSVVNRDVPLDDGYKIIIASMAGMDSHY